MKKLTSPVKKTFLLKPKYFFSSILFISPTCQVRISHPGSLGGRIIIDALPDRSTMIAPVLSEVAGYCLAEQFGRIVVITANKKTPALGFEEQESSACQQALMANSIAVNMWYERTLVRHSGQENLSFESSAG